MVFIVQVFEINRNLGCQIRFGRDEKQFEKILKKAKNKDPPNADVCPNIANLDVRRLLYTIAMFLIYTKN